MNSRKNYKKSLAKNTHKRTAKGALLAVVGIGAIAGTVPVLASTWVANTPESIQIKENDTSYTMVYGDTLWAISMKINVNVRTLAAINNIDLAAGEEYHLAVGTVIKWDKQGNLVAETANGNQINTGLTTNDSNKIIPDKPIGADVTEDVKENNIPDNQINGNPDNTNEKPKDESTENAADSEDTNNGATDPTTPDDKWNDLIIHEEVSETEDWISSHLYIGPFDSEADAEEYFNYRGFGAGNIFSGKEDLVWNNSATNIWSSIFGTTGNENKWFVYALWRSEPKNPETPVTPETPTEPETPVEPEVPVEPETPTDSDETVDTETSTNPDETIDTETSTESDETVDTESSTDAEEPVDTETSVEPELPVTPTTES
jgi:LysM repeat protein